MYEGYPDDILRKINEYGPITIITYQQLQWYLANTEFCNSIDYAVLDEAHYFTSDASFSTLTGSLLYQIPQKFAETVRIYMSTTIDEILPYICAAECHTRVCERWKLRFLTNRNYHDWNIQCADKIFRDYHPETNEKLASDFIYVWKVVK